MSTRGLLGFVHKGEIRASYNHFDSYPEGLGQGIVNLCNIIVDWDGFTSRYEKIKWISKQKKPIKYLSGKEIIMEILKDNPLTLLDEQDFAQDDIFCEYAYMINLDTKELEIYASNYHTNYDQSQAKLPLNLLVVYPLDNIPNNWLDSLNQEKSAINIDWKDRLKKSGIDPDEFLKDE
jgi:hypothetical protein